MKRTILLITLICSTLIAGPKIGIIIKVTGSVNVLHDGDNNAVPARPGLALEDKDMIQTGDGGFATALYLDDKTQIKVAANSEYRIGGTSGPNGINKKVDVSYGKLRATVAKQHGKEFLIATPTSVASVKGTDFIVVADPNVGDAFMILEGVVEVTNNLTGISQTVSQNQTANSDSDGNVDVTETQTDDIPDFENGEEQGQDVESNQREIRIEMTDPAGNTKELVIRIQ